MIVPDYVSAIIACRVWQWDETGLRSLNGEPWLAGRLLAAGCRAGAAGTWVHGATYKVTHTGHQAPAEDCSCGVYAAKSLSHLRWSGYDRYGIHGEVYLWGALVEHERGWRAQYAYPKSFVLPLEMMPVSVTILEARMAALAAYGCDVSVAGSKGIVPLWRKGSGYDAAGLALLIERCQDWYTRRAQKRRIKRGVRVAILGHGIAVVEQADEVQVTAVLWNQNRLRIGRKAIVWNEGNRRWEASHWAFARQHLARSACRRDLGLLPGLCILKGKAGHTRTIPMPAWVKQVLDPWLQAADINSGKLFRRVRKMGKSWEERLTEKAVWHVVREYAAKSNIDKLAPHDLRRTCARL